MDANRFDALAKTLTGTRSRRSAIGSVVASGVLGALGLGQGASSHVAAQGGGLCVVDFQAIVRQGPGATRSLVPGAPPGALRGYLRFSLSESGNLEDADLLLANGTSLSVVGQATGHGIQARIDLGQGQALVAVGVGEQEVTRCLGRLDGTTTSTEIGDLGEWHARAGVQNIPAGTGQTPPGGGNRPASGSDGSGSGSSSSGGATGQQSAGNRPGDGNSGSGDSAPSEIALACPEGQTRCDGACVDLQTDPVNCGQCALPCASELGAGSCIAGRCACPSGTTRCNDICVNTDRDPLNCGQCGNACPAGLNCFTGECLDLVQPCLEGQERCGDVCVDVASDAANCGRCGNACPSGQACQNGSCPGGGTGAPCAEGETRCSGACVKTMRDVFNCGACGVICALDEECDNGQCRAVEDRSDPGNDGVDAEGTGAEAQCETGKTRCGDTCTDLETDESNCGTCGTTCATGQECIGGTCEAATRCPEGQVLCGTECRNGLTLPNGGIVCAGGGAPPTECPPGLSLCNGACLADGTCQPVEECPAGHGLCYGICRDFQNDPGYCGGCDTGCTGGAYCREGKCFYCSDEFTPCGDKCVDTRTDLDNCGTCGNRCGTQCIDGQCTGVGPTPLEPCAEGLTRCGTACVDLKTDVANCGICGRACASPMICVETGSGTPPGTCFIPHEVCRAQGLESCGYKCVDYLTDQDNCGSCYQKCGSGYECRGGQCFAVSSAAAAQTLTGQGEEPPVESAPADSEGEPATVFEPEPEPEPEPAFTCPEGQVDCGGVCSDISYDSSNCGSCGFVCGSDSVCELGVCVQNAPPPAPDEEVVAEVPLEEAASACVDAGGACDPASPGSCCSGACNEDGTCA